MIPFIPLLAGLLLKRKPSLAPAHAERIAKVVLAVGAVALLVAGFLIWDHFDDKAAVKADRLETRAATAETSLVRERDANTAAAERDTARESRSDQTKEAMRHAEQADPEAAARPAGAVSRAAIDRLRTGGAAAQHTAR